VEALRARARERARTAGEPCAPELQLVVGWRLGHAVAATLRPLPTDSRCLAQSLTLLSVLERRGIEHTLVIAARPRPFAAHAWVEVGGQPMLPAADPGYERLTVL
jgi:hypothetical protein